MCEKNGGYIEHDYKDMCLAELYITDYHGIKNVCASLSYISPFKYVFKALCLWLLL